MELRLFFIVNVFSVVFAASHAALSPAGYWHSVLPNTAMPNAVKELLVPEGAEQKSTSVSVGNGGVNVNTGKGGTTVNVGPGGVGVHTGKGTNVGVGNGGVGVHTGKGTDVSVGNGGVGVHAAKATNVGVGKGGVGVQTGKGTNVGVGNGGVGVHTGKGTNVNVGNGGVGVHTGRGTNVGVGKGGVNVNTGHKGKPVHVSVDPFLYQYAATKTQLNDSANRAVFFLEKDLKPGRSMNLQFTSNDGDGTFLARSDAEKIPFSSKHTSEVLARYNVKSDSEDGQMMTKTIKECEEPAIKGEEKYCATSLESMVDFSTSYLGRNVQVLTTEVNGETQRQKYTITGVRKTKSNEAVVCHKRPYPYAVYLCHHFPTARAYTVSMTGADSTKANAVAVCHTDTSSWNPRHLAFQVLKVQPGTVPVCHYLPQGHLVWVSK